MTWTTPPGNVPRLCQDILKQPHTLISGATGSGKSVLINSIIYTAAHDPPTQKTFVLIDPKLVELFRFKQLPHTIGYADTIATVKTALDRVISTMMHRYRQIRQAGGKTWTGSDIYIVIDELADLVTVDKSIIPPLARIAQLGRAARIHLLLATQRPTSADILPGVIKVNIDARIALLTPTAQDSRNIIHTNGAELLPRIGKGYYLTPETIRPVLVDIPLTPENDIDRIIKHWTQQIK